MQYYSIFTNEKLKPSAGHSSYIMLGAEQGCVGDCAAGISVYFSHEFSPAQSHPYQEGFYVISGVGLAKVGDNIFEISEAMSFLVPRGTEHSICSSGAEPVKVFWFHCT